MKSTYRIHMGHSFPMGVSAYQGGINIAVAFSHRPQRECGILLYSGNRKIAQIPFSDEYMTGFLYTVRIENIEAKKLCYQFYLDDEVFVDAYAKKITGRGKWAGYEQGVPAKAQVLPLYSQYDWEGDISPQIPYEESIFYSLHVRGFTRHVSSKVQNRGTFNGLAEKIPYLKELGITGIVCMPFYEFEEIILNPEYKDYKPMLPEFAIPIPDVWKYRTNYWGFADTGNYYMAPKAAYASDPANAGIELRDMVKKMHQNGIEVLMQIYFSKEQTADYIRDVVRFWVAEYHIDGFQLLGVNIPMVQLAQDPMLGRTKLICEHVDGAGQRSAVSRGYERNIARYQDGFRVDCRRFLKGDEDMLYAISQHMRENSTTEAVVHHITDYRGFTLNDLVSYESKHNDANGEKNRDGSDYNYSWNCGYEGPSRRRAIRTLRVSQRKNAIMMLLFAQGTPLILAGDEIGHTTYGNNNAYCQDNQTNWLNWNLDHHSRDFLAYVKACIAFRKAHPILHRKTPMRAMDTISCGYPDISYHGEQAWYMKFRNYDRYLGILYCGLYEKTQEGTDGFIYLAMNMHWVPHEFALPQVPVGYQWRIALFTGENSQEIMEKPSGADTGGLSVCAAPRSMMVLIAEPADRRKEE